MKPLHVAAAVVVLGAAAFVGVALLTGPSSPPPAPSRPEDARAVDPGLVSAPALVPAVATTTSAPVPAAGPPEWSQVEIAVRPAGLGPELAAPVSDGLDALRDTMGPCFDAERAHPHRPAARGQAAQGPAVLVLSLEAPIAGHLVVAGTEVEATGFSSRELVECCRQAAKGYELSAPGVEVGRRVRVKMLVQ